MIQCLFDPDSGSLVRAGCPLVSTQAQGEMRMAGEVAGKADVPGCVAHSMSSGIPCPLRGKQD